jgi:hypothetical protein
MGHKFKNGHIYEGKCGSESYTFKFIEKKRLYDLTIGEIKKYDFDYGYEDINHKSLVYIIDILHSEDDWLDKGITMIQDDWFQDDLIKLKVDLMIRDQVNDFLK